MSPFTWFFFTFDWFHRYRQLKCTKAHDPAHLHGLQRNSPSSSPYSCMQYLHYPAWGPAGISIFFWKLRTLSTSINFYLICVSAFFVAQTDDTKYSFWPILSKLPYSKHATSTQLVSHTFVLLVFHRSNDKVYLVQGFITNHLLVVLCVFYLGCEVVDFIKSQNDVSIDIPNLKHSQKIKLFGIGFHLQRFLLFKMNLKIWIKLWLLF